MRGLLSTLRGTLRAFRDMAGDRLSPVAAAARWLWEVVVYVRDLAAWLALVAWAWLPVWARVALTFTVGLPVWLWYRSPRWGRLLDYYAVVGVLWWWIKEHPTSPTEDAWTLFGIGAIYALLTAVMLIGTRTWTGRGLGLLGTANGDGLVYLTVSSGFLAQVPDLPDQLINAARANFYAGGGLLILMVARYVVVTRGMTREFFSDAERDWRDDVIAEQTAYIAALEARIRVLTDPPPV